MEMYIDFQDLFYTRVLYGSLLGVLMVAWFWKMSRRDSDDWKPENRVKWKNYIRIAIGIVFLLVALALFIAFIINWINSDSNLELHKRYDWFDSEYSKMKFMYSFYVGIISFMLLGFAFLSFGVYTLGFRPSPRSFWIKIRKCIAYYAVLAVYISFMMTTLENLYLSSYVPVNSSGIIVGNILTHTIEILLIWLLLRHYKNERFIPYKNYSLNIENQEEHVVSDNMPASSKKRPSIMEMVVNKKRMLAYYVGYETFLFAFFLVNILIILSDDGSIGIPIVLFLGLSVLPIGIYWMLRLLRESKQ